ncbi:hypothetical protein AVEN_69053-1 [Araneus ventricosus]|uniref:Uncharacterized protein n=1 Tax=Araneus ventricosus TaxID=182803 RepID=A0A4Y2VRU0_ARAVE|nr:hypothetical protein AVEN_69053-1 [Araneus ventricosus]
MSLIHADSQAGVKSELDLFLTPPTQTAIEKGQWLEYHPIANIRDGNLFEFSISGSGEDYIDVSTTQLHQRWFIGLSDMAQRDQERKAEETEEQRNSRLSDMAQRSQERRDEENIRTKE